jgi:nucleotide-binding universal stress UspA family protein
MKFEHVLIATDGSDSAKKAASVAGELARALGASVSVLFVQDDALVVSSAWGASGIAEGKVEGAMTVEQVRTMLEKQAHDTAIAEAIDAIGSSVDDVRPTVVWGHPASEICRYARENDVDLIVIGSHGRSGIREALLGSVSHAVSNRASCPVTIVR